VDGQQLVRYQPQADGSYAHTNDFFAPPYSYNLTAANRFEPSGWPGVGVADHVVTTKQLVATDGRLMFWNNPTALSLGQAPTGCVGPDCLTIGTYGMLKVDASDRVWVSLGDHVQVYQAPLTASSTPIATIAGPLPALGGASVTFPSDGAMGLAPSPDGQYLWLAQTSYNRVIRVHNPLTSPVVDVVLGQTSLTATSANQGGSPTLSTLSAPGAMSIDRQGNLFVSDHWLEISGNQRLLVFTAGTFPSNPASVIYAPAAWKEFPASNPYLPHTMATFEPAFDSTNRMVVGLNPYSIWYTGWYPNNLIQRYPMVFENPLTKNASNPSDPAYALPNRRLEDFYGWAVAATFDSSDNLYVYDANRGRVDFYKTPFVPTASIHGQYANGDPGAPFDNVIKAKFELVNKTSSAIPMSQFTIRYYYNSQSSSPAAQNFWVDYATIGNSSVHGRFVPVSCGTTDNYLEVSFTGGTLPANGSSGEIQTRAAKPDWSNYDEYLAYSYIWSQQAYADSSQITVYQNGVRVWGTPPSGCIQ
jgi:hypothetical protein